MADLRAYLIQVTAGAVLCGVVTALLGKTETVGKIIKLLAGVFMTLVVFGPLLQIRWNELLSYQYDVERDAASVVSVGADSAKEALAEGIKAATRTYILDKAEMLGADVAVEVMVSSSDPPVPIGVRITGTISPYGKSTLSDYIASELGIAQEDQIWSG